MHGWHLEFRCQSFDCLSTRAVARGARQFARAVKDTRQHTSRTRGSTRHRHAAPHVKDTRQHTPKTRGNTRQRHAAAHDKDTRQHTGAKMWHATRKTGGTRLQRHVAQESGHKTGARRQRHLPQDARHTYHHTPGSDISLRHDHSPPARLPQASWCMQGSKKRAAHTVCQRSGQQTLCVKQVRSTHSPG